MSYWRGLMLAAVIDLAWFVGCPFVITDPEPPALVHEFQPPVQLDSVVEERDSLAALSRVEDSLMTYLQSHGDDVDAMETLARVYIDNEWYEAALGPLARGLEIDPRRRSLWVMLDTSIEKTGRQRMTDADLAEKAAEFKGAIEMWGQGC